MILLNDFSKVISLHYVWFPENLRENVRKIKYKGKVKGNKGKEK